MKPLIVDNGMYTSLAARMARDGEVAYFSTWLNAFPQSRELAPATGLKNVERVDDPIQFMLDGKASHLIVPYLYLNGIERLGRAMDIPTFGCGEGNRLETDRAFLTDWLAENGLDTIETVEAEGIDALESYLRKHEDKYVKVSVFRGDMESFHHVKWDSTEVWFNDLKQRLGPLGQKIRFLAQDPIPEATEVGIDTIFHHGEFGTPALIGVERKDAAYFGRAIGHIPEPFAPITRALSTYFKKHDYNCFFSNEMRINQQGIFMTDATCRIPSPPGGVMINACRNLSDVILKGDEPDYGDANYFCEIVLKSDWVRENFLQVTVPDEIRYAFHNYCKIDKKIWIIPHDSHYVEFGSALGWGKTADAAISMCEESAKAVEAYQLTFDATELRKAQTELAGLLEM